MIHEDAQCSVVPRRNPEPSKGLIEKKMRSILIGLILQKEARKNIPFFFVELVQHHKCDVLQ